MSTMTKTPSGCVVTGPEALVEAGYEAPATESLVDDPQYLFLRAELDRWCGRLPGLHTPREADGSGGTPPKEHQLKHAAVQALRQHGLMAWSMGTGKTMQSILVILMRYGHRMLAGGLRPGTIQIACPGFVRSVWVKELTRSNLQDYVVVIEDEADMRSASAPIWVYADDLPRRQSARGKAMKRAGTGLRLHLDGRTYFGGHVLAKVLAKEFPPSMLVVDEVHRLRKGTERTRCMGIVGRKARHRLGLTGTPMDGWVHHAAAVLAFIYGQRTTAFPYTVAEFARTFTRTQVVNVDVATGREAAGKEKAAPGVDILKVPAFLRATRHLMHRLNLTDDEVKANVVFPPTVVHDGLQTMDLGHRMFYETVLAQGLKDIKAARGMAAGLLRSRTMLTVMHDLRSASSEPHELGYELERSTAVARRLVDIVREYSAQGRKGLIGTNLVGESRMLHRVLEKAGLKGIRLYADDPGAAKKSMGLDRREDLIEDFMDDPDVHYLICNKELVAEGLNLAETASYAVSCSFGYRSTLHEQWLGRVVRPGQQWPHVNVHILGHVDTIDVYIRELVGAKTAANASLIDLDFAGGVQVATQGASIEKDLVDVVLKTMEEQIDAA